MSDKKAKEVLARVKAPIDTVLLDDISRAIRKVLQHLEETTIEGVDVPLPEPTVTSAKPEFIDVAHTPLRVVYIRNKGPDPVFYRINDDPTEIELESGESIRVERPKRTIVKVTLRTDSGKSATVRLLGQY